MSLWRWGYFRVDFCFQILLCLVCLLGWRYATPIGNGDDWTSEENVEENVEELSLPFHSSDLTESKKLETNPMSKK